MAEPVRIKGITLEDLMEKLVEDKRVEVVDGEFKESDPMTAGYLHLHIVGNIFRQIDPYIRRNRLGIFGGDGLTCVLHTSSEGVRTSRIPDLVYIHKDRIPKSWDIKKPFPGAPNLAVEVVSPNEKSEETQRKIDDYLTYGTDEVWVLYPETKVVHRYEAAQRDVIRILQEADTLQTPLFPELELPIAAFFAIDLSFDD